MRAIFTQELSQIGEDLLEMSRLVSRALSGASRSLLEADVTLAEQVIDADLEIDELQNTLDERCVTLLARQHPVATDLRIVVSGLRMSASLERMGDLARHVAIIARLRFPESALSPQGRELLQKFADAAQLVAQDVVELMESHSLELAAKVQADDDILDDLHAEAFSITMDPAWEGTVAQTVDLTLLARFYERFGDHAVSVARRISYLVTGDEDSANVEADSV